MENLEYLESHEQVVKKVMVSGGSGSVYVPKDWIGQRVIVRPLSIKDNILQLVSPYMEKVMGIYLYGSYARGEETPESDIDVLLVTDGKIELSTENGFDIEVVEYERIKELVSEDPVGYHSMVKEAVPIMNGVLLNELRGIKPNEMGIKTYYESTISALSIVGEFLDRKDLSREDFPSILYSLILRLRGLYLIRCNLQGRRYSNAKFEDFVVGKGILQSRYRGIYATYRAVRDNKKMPKYYVSRKDVELLYEIVSKELKWQSERRGQGRA